MLMHERIIDLIQAEDIDTILGIPDPSFFGMYVEAEKRGMRIVAPHHEEAACFMSDALYRMTGKPGVVVANKGPGVANLVSGAIHSAKELAPTVFIGGQRHRIYEQRARRGKIQYLSQPQFFESFCKYVGVIEYPEQVDEIIQEAFRQATSGTPGPVYVDFPMSVLFAKLDLPPAPPPSAYRLVKQEAGTEAVERAVGLLRDASLPVLLVGSAAFATRSHEAVARLAKTLACPVLQTSGGCSVPEGIEDQTFQYGTATGAEIAGEADVVVAIGTELGEPVHYGRGQHWSKGNTDRKWIHIERDPTTIGANRPIDVALVGDLRDVVPQLTRAAASLERSADARIETWTKARDAARQASFDACPAQSSPVHPGRLAMEVSKVIPRDSVIIRDGGATGLYFAHYLQFLPRDLFWNANYGSIGPGLPYACGAQLGVGNDRSVVLMTGDSSFLFHVSELETAVRKNLPIICVVGVDHAWGIEVASYRAILGPDTGEPEGHWSQGVRLDRTAESFGAHGEYVEKVEEIAPAMERALASGKPAVIHVEIDPVANNEMSMMPDVAEFRTWYGEPGDNLGAGGSNSGYE